MFKYEVMLCFWFAIHIEAVEVAQFIYKIDPVIFNIMTNLRKFGEEAIDQKRYDDQRRARREKLKRAQIVRDESIASDEDEEGSQKEDEDEDENGDNPSASKAKEEEEVAEEEDNSI